MDEHLKQFKNRPTNINVDFELLVLNSNLIVDERAGQEEIDFLNEARHSYHALTSFLPMRC